MSGSIPTHLPPGPRAVVTRGLTKRFGGTTALRDLALEVPAGAVYLLVGANGAGKSTTLRLLLDLVAPTAGRAEVLGMDPRAEGARVRANAGYVPDGPEWGHAWMTVERLLRHHAAYFPAWDHGYARRLVEALELPPGQRVGRLSKGQARRAHLVMALAHRPPLLLLDEPTDGLDPLVRDRVLGILAEHLADRPTTVLLSTHHAAEVEGLADHVGVLLRGELRAQLSLDALRRGLRRYRVAVPEGWGGVATLNGAVVRRTAFGREVQWTVWGEEEEVVRHFGASGATVRDVSPLALDDAVIALLDADATRHREEATR